METLQTQEGEDSVQGWGEGEGWKEGDLGLCWLRDPRGSGAGRAGTAVGRTVLSWGRAASGRDSRALGVRWSHGLQQSAGVCAHRGEGVWWVQSSAFVWPRAGAASKPPACCGR